MADLTKYPSGADLEAYITSCGIDIPPGLDSDLRAQEAAEQWENDVRWHPFLNVSGDETLTFDIPGARQSANATFSLTGGGRILSLECGILSVTSLTIGTNLYVLGQDYFLRPNDALRKKWPYTYIEFASPIHGAKDSLVIVGTCGYCRTLPANVWGAIIQKATALSAPQMVLSITRGSTSYKVADIEEKFATGQSSVGGIAEQWSAAFESAVNDYRRVIM